MTKILQISKRPFSKRPFSKRIDSIENILRRLEHWNLALNYGAGAETKEWKRRQ